MIRSDVTECGLGQLETWRKTRSNQRSGLSRTALPNRSTHRSWPTWVKFLKAACFSTPTRLNTSPRTSPTRSLIRTPPSARPGEPLNRLIEVIAKCTPRTWSEIWPSTRLWSLRNICVNYQSWSLPAHFSSPSLLPIWWCCRHFRLWSIELWWSGSSTRTHPPPRNIPCQ